MECNLNNLIPFSITEESEVLVSARSYHSFLETKTNFKQWYLKMIDYGFVEGEDYEKTYTKVFTTQGEQTAVDYMMSINMAKEIALLQQSEKGKMARRYLINVEKKLKSAQVALGSLLEITRRSIRNYTDYSNHTNNYSNYSEDFMNSEDSMNSKDSVNMGSSDYDGYMIEPISADNTVAQPTYIKEEKSRTLNTNFRDTSKLFGVRENLLVNWLLLSNYCYRDKKGNIKPYAKFMDCFHMKEFSCESGHSGVQTLINPKGREFFRNLLVNENVIKEVKLLE